MTRAVMVLVRLDDAIDHQEVAVEERLGRRADFLTHARRQLDDVVADLREVLVVDLAGLGQRVLPTGSTGFFGGVLRALWPGSDGPRLPVRAVHRSFTLPLPLAHQTVNSNCIP